MGQLSCRVDGVGLGIGEPDSSGPVARLTESHSSKANTGVDEDKLDDSGHGIGLSCVNDQGDVNRCRECRCVSAADGQDTSSRDEGDIRITPGLVGTAISCGSGSGRAGSAGQTDL